MEATPEGKLTPTIDGVGISLVTRHEECIPTLPAFSNFQHPRTKELLSGAQCGFAPMSCSTSSLVESRGSIISRPSHLDLDVPLSVHPAPDILGLRFCLCEVQISRVHVFQRFSPCYSYARSRDKIRVLLLDSFCPSFRGFHLCDVDVPFLHP